MNGNGITEGVIWKQILLFFFPMLFGTLFQQLYNTIDAIAVGRFVGKEALSAVGGTTGTLINLFVNFFVGISTGATVTISQYYGANKEQEVHSAVHTAIAMAIAGGAAITAIGIIGAPVALRWMGTPEEIIPYSTIFLRIYFCGMIANLIYNMGAGILRAVGDSRRPLYFLIASCIMNIILVLLFVIVFHWGVKGTAAATVISQIFSAVLVCLNLMRTEHCYKLSLRQLHIDSNMLKRIIHIGLPAGFQSLMYSISNVIIQASINSFGTDTMASWTAYSKIDAVYWSVMASFGISVTTFVGQNYGAGKKDRVKKGINVCLAIAMTVSLMISFILYFGGTYLYRMFTTDAGVVSIGMEMLRFLVPSYFTYVFIEIYSGSLRGMGNTLIPMILTSVGICGFRIVWIFIMVPIWNEVRTVLYSYPLSWIITSIFFIIYFRYYTGKQNNLGELKANI
jgi:putative MATE family efflux protein